MINDNSVNPIQKRESVNNNYMLLQINNKIIFNRKKQLRKII